jgi:thiosulfate dehydrogenase [quinone] large subunit
MGSSSGRYTIALARIAVGIMFLFFAQYKIMHKQFVQSGFEGYVRGYYDHDMPVRFLRPTLEQYVLAHPHVWGVITAASEGAIAVSLLIGLWVRAASVGGALFMLSLTLTTWYAPGHNAPYWQYIGANLDHIPLLILFLVFFSTNAGTTLGLDGRRSGGGKGGGMKKGTKA